MKIPVEFINAVILALVGLAIWIAQDRMKKYDAHLKECNERRAIDAATDATTKQRICTIEGNSNRNRAEISWLGDCIIQVGTKLSVDLPDRPNHTS